MSQHSERPMAAEGKQYHLQTGPNDLAADCLLVGSPERAEMIASTIFTKARLVGDHRGLKSFTGKYRGLPVSVVTTGMGGASTGIVLAEAKRSGASVFMKVGTCGGLKSGMAIGDLMISTEALRFDGASDCWAKPGVPAVADHRLVDYLIRSAKRRRIQHHAGLGATTSCFYEGQGRADDEGALPPWMAERHRRVLDAGAFYYSMEDATIFIWCQTHGGHPAAAIHAVVANRMTGAFDVKGEETAALVALDALHAFRYTG